MNLICYHASCPDGWCAAYIAKKRYPEADLMPLDHGLNAAQIDEVMKAATDRDVLMVDYSLRTRELNDALNAVARSFRILDHHKTAQAALEGAPYATFDMDRSGAGLAWDYLFGYEDFRFENWHKPSMIKDILPRPWWVDYVEARDLWRWDSLPNSRAICAYLGTLPFTIEAWDALDSVTTEEAVRFGVGALAHIQHYVRETIKNAQFGFMSGYRIAILNTTYLNCSEIGNELAKEADFSLTWFERKDSMIQFSLRSIGDRDVSAIAKRFDGGGHRNAAGFQLNLYEGRRLVDAILNRDSRVDAVGPRHG